MKNQTINQCDSLNSSPSNPSNNSSQYNYPHLFKTAYGPKLKIQSDTSQARDRTKQSFKDECDINMIMSRFQKTGVLDFANKNAPQFGDCTGVEFQAGMELVARARSMFNEMPSKLRNRFSNNPAEFLEFVQNPANREEARELGLLKPEAAPASPPKPPSTETREDAPLNRAEVRKAAREAADRKEAGDDKTNSST